MAADAAPRPAPRCAEVTVAITAATSGFTFLQPYRGGDVIRERNTLIALTARPRSVPRTTTRC